jgi:hypothetical protein
MSALGIFIWRLGVGSGLSEVRRALTGGREPPVRVDAVEVSGEFRMKLLQDRRKPTSNGSLRNRHRGASGFRANTLET